MRIYFNFAYMTLDPWQCLIIEAELWILIVNNLPNIWILDNCANNVQCCFKTFLGRTKIDIFSIWQEQMHVILGYFIFTVSCHQVYKIKWKLLSGMNYKLFDLFNFLPCTFRGNMIKQNWALACPCIRQINHC